jgi:hypothetical protein
MSEDFRYPSFTRPAKLVRVEGVLRDRHLNTYRIWLRYELFPGRLTDVGLAASEANLHEYIRSRSNTKPHLIYEDR